MRTNTPPHSTGLSPLQLQIQMPILMAYSICPHANADTANSALRFAAVNTGNIPLIHPAVSYPAVQ
jgi:hypothetical protein